MNNYTALQSMMIQIVDEGVGETLAYIETISNATERFRKRNIFYRAVQKMKDK